MWRACKTMSGSYRKKMSSKPTWCANTCTSSSTPQFPMRVGAWRRARRTPRTCKRKAPIPKPCIPFRRSRPMPESTRLPFLKAWFRAIACRSWARLMRPRRPSRSSFPPSIRAIWARLPTCMTHCGRPRKIGTISPSRSIRSTMRPQLRSIPTFPRWLCVMTTMRARASKR